MKRTKDEVPGQRRLHTEVGRLAVTHLSHHHDIWVLAKNRAQAICKCQPDIGVDLNLIEGEVHALIGPNGAGKSTLIAQLCGELRPDAGTITFDGVDVTALPAHLRARKGLSRSFQITELCPDFSALENVMLSLTLTSGRAFQAWSDPRRDSKLMATAQRWLEEVGLAERANTRVSDLAHGEKRQVE